MIHIKYVGGVGGNAKYHIIKDNQVVAELRRGRGGWNIYSIPYDQILNTVSLPSIDEARDYALKFNYPSEPEIYEQICAAVERVRRTDGIRRAAAELYQVAKLSISDPIGARIKARAVLDEIEKYATDRHDINASGYGGYIGHQGFGGFSESRYPKPPATQDVLP